MASAHDLISEDFRRSLSGRAALVQRELFLWLALILFANQLFSSSTDVVGVFGEQIVQILLSRSIFYYLGWYVVFSQLAASKAGRTVSRFDIAAVFSVALLNLVPGQGSTWLATTAAALLLYARSQNDTNLRAASVVLFALALNGFWGTKLFDAFAYLLVHVDAALVGLALAFTQPGMEWQGTIVGQPNGHSLIIFGPCSSFHNISLGLLCWVSITKITRPTWIRSDFAVALIICAVVIFLNTSRLYLMALSEDHYAYWHTGPGEQIMASIMTVSVLLISLWGAFRRGARR